ncbi:hypothetical protein GUITHDRAFT_113374 [Guillardia theta CCMP2712]|uniref:indole-3-glycerol-phosphate synthase n=1 Tax=Guillardia theta (strain CCMP2712) TaxID=905079 RepID=L1IWU4_GUITC|nr:hypothetical protein GUITHDRAFT_113374 [Guillardia theta CCMP2712]EKX40587.1 hypothetical protein GUITHDRAFT_113374 [Guillardia theta CCMP2712]|eukprot:XP_005827567.1 hypothetical protein GUITHDRAFT_113374 [Guillardia theta CCMP2712]
MLRLLSVGLLLAAQGSSMGYELKRFGLGSHARLAPCVQPGFVSFSALPKFAMRAPSDLAVARLRPKAAFAVRRARLGCRSLGMMADEGESPHASVDSDEAEATWTLQDDLERIRAALDPGSESGRKLQETIEKLEKLSDAAVQPKSTKLFKSVKKRTGAFAVMVETCLEEGSEQEVVDLSRQIRQSKSSGIMIDVRNTFSSDGRQSFDQISQEQRSAKGNFPGPCPIVVRHRSIAHPWQVAEISCAGAEGVVLSCAALSDQEWGSKLIQSCNFLGLEVLVEVSDEDEVKQAVEAGAKIVCVRGVESVEEAVILRASIPDTCAAVCAVPAQQEDNNEIVEVERLKQAKYDAVILMDAALSAGPDRYYVQFALNEILVEQEEQLVLLRDDGNPDKPPPGMMPAAQEAAKRNPRAWAKAQREAKKIVSDYKRGVRVLDKSRQF